MKLLVLLFCMVVVVHFDCVESCNTQLVTEGLSADDEALAGREIFDITQCKLVNELGYPVKSANFGVCGTNSDCLTSQGSNNDIPCYNYCIFTLASCYGICEQVDECSGSQAGPYKCVCYKADESNRSSTQPPSGK
eukprot:TCONS_00068036-protein